LFKPKSAVGETSMSDQNVTRRDAAKQGGALTSIGLFAGVSAAPPTAPAPATDYPEFRGDVRLVDTNPQVGDHDTSGPQIVMLAGYLPLTGSAPVGGMILRFVIIMLLAGFVGCSGSSFKLAGMPEVDFHGVK
jgi:hypothetical protein